MLLMTPLSLMKMLSFLPVTLNADTVRGAFEMDEDAKFPAGIPETC